jgi:hypothetical protein
MSVWRAAANIEPEEARAPQRGNLRGVTLQL